MFLLDVRHWRTVAAFEQHLAGYDPQATAPWAKGITLHHTYRPLASQWVGEPSIKGLVATYLNKKPAWDRGPHLFIVAGAPAAANDGIWQFTPLNVPGIHAGPCNSSHWGLEVVGDYDRAPWPAPVAQLALGAGAALLRWHGLSVSPQTVRGHRDCLDNKSCPGKAIHMDDIRAALLPYLAPTPPPQPGPRITEDQPILGPPTCTQEQATAYVLSRNHSNYTSADLTLTIIPGYWSICLSVGVNPAMAIAQMIHEGALHAFWGRRPQRNPAGIGVNGDHQPTRPGQIDGWAFNTDPGRQRWERGISFDSWVGHAIPAQVGRLLAYALPEGVGTATQLRLIATALSWRPLARAARGSAPTLKPLGAAHNPANSGRPRDQWIVGWAWDGEEYGARIAAIMEAMQRI